MESEKKFTEGIKSYRTRLEHELEIWRLNLPGFDDPRNSIFQHRILVHQLRRSLDKINSYMHNIEVKVEEEYNATNAENISTNALRTAMAGGENLPQEPDVLCNARRDGKDL